MKSAVPDVLAHDLVVVFCGINPGRVSAAAAAHFANPRNDFWRLLHAAGFTSRLLGPEDQFDALRYGIGITNAAPRTTPGSGDLRSGDFAGAAERLERIARELRPKALAFVGKEAYRGTFRERPELGPQLRTLADTGTFVLPSTSPANAAVPYAERLRWFRALRDWLDGDVVERPAVRALVLDEQDRVLLLHWEREQGTPVWITPGGAMERGESHEDALRRELNEEVGLDAPELGPWLWSCEFVLPSRADRSWTRQRERHYLVRVRAADVVVPDLVDEEVRGYRWWTVAELESTGVHVAPRRLAELVRGVLEHGPPPEPLDAGA